MSAFRRRNAAVVAARHFGPDMTPMVDIVMVILIFFMAGSAFIGPEWFLDVGMARSTRVVESEEPAPTSLELPSPRMVIRLSRAEDGSTSVTGLGLDRGAIAQLEERLRDFVGAGAAAGSRLVIEPARDIPYQDVIRVYELCRRSEVDEVTLARSREPEQ